MISHKDKNLKARNNQRKEKCVGCVWLLYNWDLCVFLADQQRQLRTLKFTIYSLNSSCLSMDRYQHEMEAKYVSQPKPEMTWHPRSIPAGHSETRELRNDVNSMRFIERNHA